MIRTWIAVFAVACLLEGRANAQSFERLGYLYTGGPGYGPYSEVTGLSADGRIAVGLSDAPYSGACCHDGWNEDVYQQVLADMGNHWSRAFRWEYPGSLANLGFLAAACADPTMAFDCRSVATAISADGQVIVGWSESFIHGVRAFRWTTGGMVPVTGGPPGFVPSTALAVSTDGQIVAGSGAFPALDGVQHAFVEYAGAIVLLPEAGADASSCLGVAATGGALRVVGVLYFDYAPQQAVIWERDPILGTWSYTLLPDVGFESWAIAISADAMTIAGGRVLAGGYEAYRWRFNGSAWVATSLGALPGGSYVGSTASAVSADGTTIVGVGVTDVGFGDVGRAFVWTRTDGMRELTDVLASDFGVATDDTGFPLTGWGLMVANAISADGLTIAGGGNNAVTGHYEAFRARLGNTRPGTNVPVALNGGVSASGGASVTFASVTTGGNTTLTPAPCGSLPPGACSPMPEGFQLCSGDACFDISTTAAYAGTITICYNFAGVTCGTGTPELWHCNSVTGMWELAANQTVTGSVICAEVSSLSPFAVLEPAITTVAIDIKPYSYPNSINLGSNGGTPVAILGSDTFDAASVDPLTVTLAGAQVRLRGNGTPLAALQDTNCDGNLDLVVHVLTSALELSSTDTDAVLEALTFSGDHLRGTDTVRIVP